MTKYCIFFLILVALDTSCHAQSKACADAYSLETIQNALSAPESFSVGWQEAAVNRMGDRAAVSILKLVEADQLAKPEVVNKVLMILQEAFARPEIVAAEEDRVPQVTRFVLRYLSQQFSSPPMRDSINKTSNYIEQQAKEYLRKNEKRN